MCSSKTKIVQKLWTELTGVDVENLKIEQKCKKIIQKHVGISVLKRYYRGSFWITKLFTSQKQTI